MNITIETKALKTFLYGILSCKCPVTKETEKKLFKFFLKKESMDYLSILAIADKNPERTPIHNLFDFCTWARDDLASFTITANEVLRYLGSSFHYNMVVSNNPGIEMANPGLLLSHVLVPVFIRNNESGIYAIYENKHAPTCFKSIIIPEDLEMDCERYALHMGVVLCGLSGKQADMLNSHQALIKDFSELAGRVKTIDFKNLPPYGNHFSQVIERFKRNELPVEENIRPGDG